MKVMKDVQTDYLIIKKDKVLYQNLANNLFKD